MEINTAEKKSKASKPAPYTSVHMRKETKKRISADLARVNKKDFGRTIRADEYLTLAVSLITPEHLQQLQETSLSNSDRLERDYRAYIAKNGQISKDEYLGKRLSGELGIQKISSLEPSETSSKD